MKSITIFDCIIKGNEGIVIWSRFHLSSLFKAEKFGDSFVFEGILSDSVKREITQAVSKTCIHFNCLPISVVFFLNSFITGSVINVRELVAG